MRVGVTPIFFGTQKEHEKRLKRLDMARYGPFNNPQKIVGSCNLGNFGNFWHEMANSKIAKSVI